MKRGKLFLKCKIGGASGFYLIDRLHRQNVPIYNVETGENYLILSIDCCDSKKLFAISRNMCYNITIIKYYGKKLPFTFLVKRLGLILCFALFLALAILADGWISKIVYKGDGQNLIPYVEQILRNEGVKENSFFVQNEKELSQKILKSSDKFSFVSVEKVGRLLVIEAYGAITAPEPIDIRKQKITSTVKGEVVAINLMSGTLAVSVGDIVEIGQTLIDGYYLNGEEKIETYALGEVEIKAEFIYEYLSFAKGDSYKERAKVVATETLGAENVIDILVEEKEQNKQTIYVVTIFYTVTVS